MRKSSGRDSKEKPPQKQTQLKFGQHPAAENNPIGRSGDGEDTEMVDATEPKRQQPKADVTM